MDATEAGRLDGKLVTMITVAVFALVAVVVGAFVLSYAALTAVAQAAHVAVGLSWLMSVSVDGAMTVGTMAALVLKMLGKKTGYAWFVVLAGVVISVACNALHATQSQGGKVVLDNWQAGAVSAIPAVALALSLHLLIILIEAITDAVSARRTDGGDVSEDAVEGARRDAPQVSVERLPAIVGPSSTDAPQTPRPLLPTTLYRPSAGVSSPTVSQVSAGAVEDGRKDTADGPEDTPGDAPAPPPPVRPEPVRNTVRTPPRRPSARPVKATTAEVSTRDKTVKILTADPEMTAADLARELGLEPSGYVRTLRREVLTELAAEDAADAPEDGGEDAPKDAVKDTSADGGEDASEDGVEDTPADASDGVSGRRLHAV